MIRNYNLLRGRRDTRLKDKDVIDVGISSSSFASKKSSSSFYLGWLTAFLLFFTLGANAQVAGYVFSQSSGTYTPLSASRTILFTATAAATGDPGLGDDRNFTTSGSAIPFAFNFNGVPYTDVNINTNGFVTFGATLPTTSDRNGMTNTTAWNGSIVALGRDLSANTAAGNLGEISYEVLGTAPNRQFVIQYSKFRRFSSSTTFTENFNFQIVLNEANGVASNQTIDIIYGACLSTSTSTTATAQSLVGLRGTTIADFVNRTQTTGWAASTAGATNATGTSMRHNTTISPASGQVFTWTPPAPPAVAPNCATTTTPANLATGFDRNGTLTWTAPTGGPIATSYDVYFGTSPTPAFVTNTVGLSYTPPTMNATTTYYWRIEPRNTIGPAVGCATTSFETAANFVYCTPTYSSGACSGDNFVSVTLNTLSDTGLLCTPTYEDRTSLQNAVPNLSQTSTETISITFGTDGNQFSGVWVDFNQNGLYEASEYFSTGTNAGASGTANISILVPPGALLGNTKLRVRGGNDSALTSAQACGASSSGFGMARDYTVTIVGPPACIAPSTLAANTITTTTANLTWVCASCTGTFRVEYNTTPATFGGVGNVVIDPATSGAAISGLLPGTAYTFFVRQDCGGAGFSTVSSGSFTTATPGETCLDAAEITVYPDLASSVNTLLTTAATADGPAGTCSDATGNPNKKDRWVKFVAPSNGNKIRISTSAGTISDMVMQVWSACPATGTALGCNDDSVGLMPALEFCQNQYIGGETYYVQIWPYSATATGNFNIRIHEDAACPIPPDNDDCAGVETIAVGLAGSCPTNATLGTTVNATSSAGVVKTTCDPFGTYLDVIYKFNSGTTSDINFAFTNLTGTNEFGIYDSCGTVYLGICNSGTFSTIITGLTLNTDYYVIVWANTPAAAGTFSICINSIAAPICVAAPLAPANGATTVDSCSTTTLSWTGVPDAIAYDVFFDAGAGPATTLVSADQTAFIGTNTYTIPTLLAPATSYSWRVIGKNSTGPATGCSDFTFTTLAAVAPGCVSAPTAPAEASTICAGSTVLSWPAVAGATLYDVYVDGLLVSDNQAGLTFTTTLAAGAHTWQIIPSNCVGDATGCATFNFTSSSFVPVGDTFANPINIGVLTTPVSVSGNTLAQNCWNNDFDTTTTPGSTLGRASNDVFYRIELTCAGTITAGLCTNNFDTYLHLLDSTGTPVTQDDDSCPTNTGSLFTSTAQPAGVYYLVVEGFGTATGTYTLDVSTTPTAPCSSAVTLKLFIEGYYIGGGAMTTVADNQAGNPPTTTNVETVTVELHDATAPYALVTSATGMLQTDGIVNVSFTSAPSGSFYVAVKASNAVQTWSAAPLTVGTTPLVYNFTDAANKAFGDNMIEIETGVFAFFSGDINDGVSQDGNVDGTDYSLWEADNNNFAFGPFATDLNGDGSVDAGDYSIWEANNNNFIFANFPQ